MAYGQKWKMQKLVLIQRLYNIKRYIILKWLNISLKKYVYFYYYIWMKLMIAFWSRSSN